MFNYVPTVVRLWLSLWDKNINGADGHKSDAFHKTLRPPVIPLVLRSRIRNVVSKSTAIWISEDLASFSAEEEEAPSLVLVALTHNYLSRCQKKHFDGNFLPNNPENEEKQSIFLRVLMDLKKKKKSIFCVIDSSGCFLHISVSWILHNSRVVHVCCCFHTRLKACAGETARPSFFKFTPRPLKCTAAAESQT